MTLAGKIINMPTGGNGTVNNPVRAAKGAAVRAKDFHAIPDLFTWIAEISEIAANGS